MADEVCKVCGEACPVVAPWHMGGAPAEYEDAMAGHWFRGYEREKARAEKAEAELARHETCVADNGKAFDKSLSECLDRAEKAEAALASANAEIERAWRSNNVNVEALGVAQREVADLRDHLGACVRLVDAAGLLNLSRGVQLGATSWYVKASDAFNAARAALKPQPATGLVVCEHCPDHPHPLNDDGTKCKFPRPAPAAETGKAPAPDLLTLLRDLFGYIEDGTLVRNTACDAQPGWAPKAMKLVMTLKRVQEAIAAPAQGAEALRVQMERDIHFARERAEKAEARIAELETALRRAHGEGCVCVACEKIAPRAAPGKV
jgi:hypothetical protein